MWVREWHGYRGCMGGMAQIFVCVGWVMYVHKILAGAAWVNEILAWVAWLAWVKKAVWVNVLLFNHTLQKTLRVL